MNILGFLSRTGRARNRMQWRQKWASGNRDFKRLGKDWKEESSLHDKEEVVDKQIKESMEYFDADAEFLAIKDRIDLFIKEHEVLRDMEFLVTVEEDRMIKNIQAVQEKLGAFQGKHPSAELTEAANHLHQMLNKAEEFVNMGRKQAMDVLKDRDKLRDQSIWGHTIIYLKVRALAKEGRKDAKKAKGFHSHLMHVLEELMQEKARPQEVTKRVKDFLETLKKEERDVMEELRDVAEIRKYLTVIESRNDIQGVTNLVEKLKEMKFPQVKMDELEKELREAYAIVRGAQKRSLAESRAVDKDAKKAA